MILQCAQMYNLANSVFNKADEYLITYRMETKSQLLFKSWFGPRRDYIIHVLDYEVIPCENIEIDTQMSGKTKPRNREKKNS